MIAKKGFVKGRGFKPGDTVRVLSTGEVCLVLSLGRGEFFDDNGFRQGLTVKVEFDTGDQDVFLVEDIEMVKRRGAR